MSAISLRLLRPWSWLYAAAVVFAAGFVWSVGHRGIQLLDQSIMFDGAWRVYQGQVPYRDFVSAFPPVPFFIQSLFFHFTAVDFSAMVLAAAVLNAIATICVIWLTCRFVPDLPAVALAAGLLTGAWFQAPYGTLWFEQTAFFFNLLALVLLVKCLDSGSYAAAFRLAAGVLLSASMLSKQNAGVEFVPIALGVAVIPQLPQMRKATIAISQTLAGLFLGFGMFAIWLWSYSSPVDFWHYYVGMARQIGADRINLLNTAWGLFNVGNTWRYSIIALAILAAGLLASRRASTGAPDRRLIAWIVVGCIFYQILFKVHTDNESENALPYLGLISGLSFGLFWKYALPAEIRTAHWVWRGLNLCCVAGFILGMPFYNGLHHSWIRTVQQSLPGDTFVNIVQVPRMSRVRWAEPTRYSPRTILTQHDFEALNAWLVTMDANFFVFPDSTMLYGLQGRVSPQPWLYFSPGHSFLTEDLLKVDASVVDALRRNNVRVIILEKDSWVGNQNLWKEMPKLVAWIDSDFEKTKEFGLYEAFVSKEFLQSKRGEP